jgi:hypothetical protein
MRSCKVTERGACPKTGQGLVQHCVTYGYHLQSIMTQIRCRVTTLSVKAPLIFASVQLGNMIVSELKLKF